MFRRGQAWTERRGELIISELERGEGLYATSGERERTLKSLELKRTAEAPVQESSDLPPAHQL